MRQHVIARATDASFLPFLYQTRTILQLRPSTSFRRLTSSSFQSTTSDAEDRPQKKQSSFLKIKARASETKSRRSNPSTITPAERKVFSEIFNDIAGKNSSTPVAQTEKERDNFLDHEDILSIFSSAVSSHHTEQKALAQREHARREARVDKETTKDVCESQEEYLLRYPKSLRKVARRAAQAAPVAQDNSIYTDQRTDWIAKGNTPAKTSLYQTRPAVGKDGFNAHQGAPNIDSEPGSGATWRIGRFEPDVTLTEHGIKRPSFLHGERQEGDHQDFRPSFLNAGQEASQTPDEVNGSKLLGLRPAIATGKRAEDIVSFVQRRVEDGDLATGGQSLQDDPEAMFQGRIQRYCRAEMEKIADALQDGIKRQGDVGLWNMCLARIFPMVEMLETSFREEKLRTRTQPKPPNQDEATLNAPGSTELSIPETNPPLLDLPPHVPPLYIISRLYPAALLLALRLFVTNFPSSPLPLAILPHTRSLGPTSYVLGASASFYNTLIDLRWDVYSDLRSVDGLLSEMERSGVEFDIGTWNTLVKIGGERFTDLHAPNGGGTRGASWWERPQNATWFQKVAVDWKMAVAARLREQGLGMEISEREYGNYVTDHKAGGTEQKTIWL